MKRFLVFTIVFLSSLKATSCGYSPYGEDVRYCLFRPQYFDFRQYYAFYYNNYLWGYDNMQERYQDVITYEANILDWYHFTAKKVPLSEIVSFNEELVLSDIQPEATNGLLRYLYTTKQHDAIRYLIYAKKCEGFNAAIPANVWEKNEASQKYAATNFGRELMAAYQSEKKPFLRRKYAFQYIRFAFYQSDYKTLRGVFDREFRNSRKDYLYYWSLYFHCFTVENKGNYNDMAELFAYCPEKTFASQFYFINAFKLEKALPFAKSPEQKALLYAYASARVINKNLENLKKIYAYKPKLKALDFLLLREINKIEDWVYTPFYTNYSPSIEQGSIYDESDRSKITTLTLKARAEKDRCYAKEVLAFVSAANLRQVDNPMFWRAAEIQLLFITRDFDQALARIASFEKQYKNQKISLQVEQIKALCLTARQPEGKATVLPEVNAIIEKNKGESRFLFALGRELEYKGNLLEGIALLSILRSEFKEYSYDDNDVEWRGNRLPDSSNLDVFYHYFDYLDFVYPARDLQRLINQLKKLPQQKRNSFMYRELVHDQDYLTDLLGTKYIREERLNQALLTFRSLGQKYWQENYNAWERGRFNDQLSFDQNPFYTLKYTPDFIPQTERYLVNKLSVTEHLVKYLQRASDASRQDRDYYYFLVANCYLNMTDMGNSWMMRRFNSYALYNETYLNESYIDNLEYRTRNRTIGYYNLAYRYSKSPKFKALCLHMANYAQNYAAKQNRLAREYPQYQQILSNCYAFGEFFKTHG